MEKYFAYLKTKNSNALMNIIEDDNYFYTLTKDNTTKLKDIKANPRLTMDVYSSDRKENLSCTIVTNDIKVKEVFNLFTELDFNYFGTDNRNLVVLKLEIY